MREGWEYRKLGEVATIAAGQGAPQGNDNYCQDGTPFVRAGNLEGLINGIQESEIQKVSEDVAKKHRLKKYNAGSVLFAKSGMSCMKGHVYTLKNDCYVVSHLAIITPKQINSSFLNYFFQIHKPNNLVKDAAYPSISLKDIENLSVLIPPLSEQNRIVSELDLLSSIIEKKKAQLKEYDQLAQSIFYDMFGDPVENEKGWEVKKWDDIFVTQTGKLNANAMEDDGLYPFFTCSKEVYRIRKFAFDCEALLLSGNNATANYDVKYYKGKFNAYQRTYVLTIKNKYSYGYIKKSLENKLGILQQESIGVMTKYLTKGILSKMSFCIPPLSLQQQFAEKIEAIERQKELIKQSITETETLFNSRMEYWFA